VKLALSFATAAAAVLSALSVPSAVADQPAPEVTVQWPTVTRFNPTVTTYEALVTYSGSDHLFSAFGPDEPDAAPPGATPVPVDGHVRLDPSVNGDGVMTIWSCTGNVFSTVDGNCSVAATSPHLEAYSRLELHGPGTAALWTTLAGNHQKIFYAPGAPQVATPTVTWELLDRWGDPLAVPATGTVPSSTLGRDADGYADMEFDVPRGVPDGDYVLDVRMTVDDPDFGRLSGSLGRQGAIAVQIDAVAPRLTVGKVPATFYPVNDGYLDDFDFSVGSSKSGMAQFEVRSASGARVYRADPEYITPYFPGGFRWDGHTNSNRLVPEGRYTLSVTIADDAGGQGALWTGHVRVSHQRLQFATYTRTVRAAPYLVNKFVGKCSTLSRKRGGTLGFYSQKKCTGSDRSSTVIGQFGIYIPKAFQNKYSWGRLTVNGGPTTTSRRNYLISAFVKPNGKLAGRKQLGAGRTHGGPKVELTNVVFDRTKDKPYLIWSNGLTAGSRYDVRSFTISVEYQVLR
jgi:hypothetical protein